jgi:replicative DNA helicase
VRLAGLLHLAGRDITTGYKTPVGDDTMRAAIELGRYFTKHAQAAFGEMISDPLVSDAQAVIEWCKRTGHAEFSKNDLFNGVRSARFQKSAALDAPLVLLVEHGQVRLVDGPTTTAKGGRPKSPRFAVHPDLLLKSPAQPAQPAQPK